MHFKITVSISDGSYVWGPHTNDFYLADVRTIDYGYLRHRLEEVCSLDCCSLYRRYCLTHRSLTLVSCTDDQHRSLQG